MDGWIDEGSNRVYNGYNDRLFKDLVSKHLTDVNALLTNNRC